MIDEALYNWDRKLIYSYYWENCYCELNRLFPAKSHVIGWNQVKRLNNKALKFINKSCLNKMNKKTNIWLFFFSATSPILYQSSNPYSITSQRILEKLSQRIKGLLIDQIIHRLLFFFHDVICCIAQTYLQFIHKRWNISPDRQVYINKICIHFENPFWWQRFHR